MRNVGLHVIGDSFDPKRLVSASGIAPKICKLVNPSVEYKQRVREAVGKDCLIIVRFWQAEQPLGAPVAAARVWYGQHYSQMYDMNDKQTAFEGFNEIADSDAAAYCAFEAKRLDLMHSGGFRSVVGNFSVGTPDIPTWDIYRPMLDAMRDGDACGLHEYWPPFDSWHIGRWQHVPELANVPIVVTECGREAGGWKQSAGSEDAYLSELRNYAELLGDKLGCVFTGGTDPQWDNHNVNDLWPRVTAMYESEVVEVPEVLTVQQMQQMATEIATAAGISTTIFLRLITQESNWNPNAVNKASGCTGLGQLHPRFFQGDLLDPAYNLKTSAEYLANLLRYFGDDYVSVLAGYNWGWGNVIVARKDHGGEWLLRIPNETRRYVKRILFKE
jgi:hypothetical protein